MQWRVPLSDIDFGEAEIEAVERVLRSKWLTLGETTRRFEEAFREFLNAKYAFAVANGTAALHIANQALEIGEGDEVIVPSLTFVATVNSVLYVGAKPVFADVTSKEDFNISPESIEEKVTPRTKAIVVVHYGGYPCNMNKILQIVQKHDLRLIEDAAHAPGAEYQGKKVGVLGDVGCFSFFSNKNLVCGEGGMLVTNHGELAEKIRSLRSHGMTTLTLERHRGHAFSYDVTCLGYNYRIDEIRSALGVEQLKKLESNNQRREALVQLYREILKDVEGLMIPFQDCCEKSTYHIFPVLLTEGVSRKDFMSALKERGIQTSVHYPPVHQFSYYVEQFGRPNGGLENTDYIGAHEVTLPLYPTMTAEQVSYVCETIRDFFGN